MIAPGYEFFFALSLGLLGGVIPGPVITAIFTEIIRSGYTKSLRIIFLALLIESLVALISLLFLDLLSLHEAVFYGLSFAGGIILIWIAIGVWRVRSLQTGDRMLFSTSKIILMILSNGVLWTYWITICIPRALLVGNEVPAGEYIFMGLVQGGWLLSTLLLAYLFDRFRSTISNPRYIPFLFKGFAIVFLFFSLKNLWGALRYFLA